MSIELDYLTLAKMAIAENATTPVPEAGVGSVIWSTIVNDILKWDGAKWTLGKPPVDVHTSTKNLTDFAQDTATTTGLTYGYKAGIIRSGIVTYSVTEGTLLLTASTTNYVEVSATGVVSDNVVGFTPGSYPIAQIVTDASGITSNLDKRGVISVAASSGGSVGAKMFFYAGF